MRFIDLTGWKFNELLVLEKSNVKRHNKISWNCLCDCGNELIVTSADLKYNKVKSCGCLKIKNIVARNKDRSGSKSDNWNGGIIKCNEYYYVYSPNHPYRNKMGLGYVKRCRLILEKKLGRYLKRTELVHHINDNKSDDREENLVIYMRDKHTSIHSKSRDIFRDKLGRFTKKGGDANEISDSNNI